MTYAKAFGLNEDEQARKPPGLVTKRAFEVVSKLFLDVKRSVEKIDLIRSTLQKSFGVSAEKAFALLCKREIEPHKGGIDTYASEITHLVSIAFPQWETRRIVRKKFLAGTPAVRQHKTVAGNFQKGIARTNLS